jgi:hypothetical protein
VGGSVGPGDAEDGSGVGVGCGLRVLVGTGKGFDVARVPVGEWLVGAFFPVPLVLVRVALVPPAAG